MYKKIFLTNVMTALAARHMTRRDLSIKSGVSASFLSDMTSGKANPSLRVMEAISQALEIPLPALLEPTDLGLLAHKLPDGYQRVALVLPDVQAFVAKSWAEDARKKVMEHSY